MNYEFVHLLSTIYSGKNNSFYGHFVGIYFFVAFVHAESYHLFYVITNSLRFFIYSMCAFPLFLSDMLNNIFSGLFKVLDNPDLTENDYVMKCIMRVLLLVDVDIGKSISKLCSVFPPPTSD